jgi:hypothetical protein
LDLSTKEEPHSKIMPHPLALIFGIPFALAGNIPYFRGPLEALQVLEGERLCLVERLSGAQKMESDQIALVPQWVQAGDLICGLNGESSRMVFHPIKSSGFSEEESVNDYFTFVGMCYHRGFSGSASPISKTFFLQSKSYICYWGLGLGHSD